MEERKMSKRRIIGRWQSGRKSKRKSKRRSEMRSERRAKKGLFAAFCVGDEMVFNERKRN